MRVQQFTLEHFRSIEKMELHFATRTTALVGVNGVGKSSILDALAIGLSHLTTRISSERRTARKLSIADISTDQTYTRIKLGLAMGSSQIEWALALNRKAGKHPPERSSDLSALSSRTEGFAEMLAYVEDTSLPTALPLAVYYDVHRAVLDVPMRVREKLSNKASEAYRDALGHGGTDFHSFFTWFRAKEDAENELIRDDPQYRDRDLQAVRKAIKDFTGFTDLRVRRKPSLRMTLNKNGNEFNVLQLSDGEKCMLALVGDMARRLSLLNSGLPDPLQGAGVVLIDEIDLHLHPKWQRTVVAQLERTFPNCQFIISTHSPQVISELPAEAIILLKDGKYLGHPERSFGMQSSDILDELMGASSRNEEVAAQLTAINHAIEDDELQAAQQKLDLLKNRAGEIPEVLQAQAAIDGLSMLE